MTYPITVDTARAVQRFGGRPMLGVLPPPPPPGPPTTGLLGRLRADSIAQADGSPVATWPGLVGGNAIQGTAGNRPVYKVSGINGVPSVQFTRASAHYLNWAGVPANTAVFSWLFVFLPDPAMPSGEQDNLTGTDTNPDTNPYVVFGGSASYAFILDNAGWGNLVSSTPNALTGLTKHAMAVTFDKGNAANCANYRSGTKLGAVVSNLGNPFTAGAGTIIGGWPLRNANYFNGQLAEVCKWDHVLSASELTQLFTYTLSRYGV